jgi:hypothetical protein
MLYMSLPPCVCHMLGVTHRYSWILSSLVGAVYTFGFILMCPQVSEAVTRVKHSSGSHSVSWVEVVNLTPSMNVPFAVLLVWLQHLRTLSCSSPICSCT